GIYCVAGRVQRCPKSYPPNRFPCTNIPGGPAGPDGWYVGDSFEVFTLPAGVSVSPKLLTQGQSTRQLAAAPPPNRVDPVFRQEVPYFYKAAGTQDLPVRPCFGDIVVSTVLPLKVSVIAIPTTIDLGHSSRLQTNVTGGAIPYTFSWTGSSLDNARTASPMATPSTTTTYTVTVNDSTSNVPLGQTASASVT